MSFWVKRQCEGVLGRIFKRFDIVYTGGGDAHNTVKVNIDQLEKYSNYVKWVDVCKNWKE